MTDDHYKAPSRPRPVRTIIIAMLIAFIGGLALMAWALTHWPAAQSSVTADAPTLPTLPKADVSTQHSVPATVLAPSSAPPLVSSPSTAPIDVKMVTLEARMAEIDRHANTAADQSSRAEGMLLAFAARRAVDRGVTLGYLEGQLTKHFGTEQPRAVASIIATSHAPITLDALRAGLSTVAPEADPAQTQGDWWTRTRAKFSGLITVRKAGEASATPDERLARARLALSTGAVDNAMAEVARLPGGTATNAWLLAARRYLEAHNALDLLEASALMKGDAPAHSPSSTPVKH